ncbi:phosphodiester glycosidase family protein [Sediminibacterium sp.]|uniref:phosphodiester glycosidase family protein n=1 Tax=Sediminibacterium sp. TaxID=1917865 RepID=UPI003F730F25
MYKVLFLFFLGPLFVIGQPNWVNVDTAFGVLPNHVHVYFSNDSLNGKPNKAYYIAVPLNEKELDFLVAVGNGKRFTPTEYYQQHNAPLLVVNTTFFEFVENRNLNAVVNKGQLLAFNLHNIAGKGKDTLTYRHAFSGAIGISKNRKADIAWLFTDSAAKYPLASQVPVPFFKDSIAVLKKTMLPGNFKKWKMQTAVAGGPVLIQAGQINISNNEEQRFAGKQINDKHPRTAMGYTADGHLIVMVVEGRNPGIAEGASLTQLAELMQSTGCVEALNLDGGGSSTMLINGKETIKPSDKTGQRPVPAVFIISSPKQGQKRLI